MDGKSEIDDIIDFVKGTTPENRQKIYDVLSALEEGDVDKDMTTYLFRGWWWTNVYNKIKSHGNFSEMCPTCFHGQTLNSENHSQFENNDNTLPEI